MAALIGILNKGTSHNRRAAAEALGRIGDPAAALPLLVAAGEELDRTFEHSVIYALIELAASRETAPGLARSNPRTRRAALLAIDQMDGGGLEPAAVAELITSNEPQLREAASSILARHGDWAGKLAPWLREQLVAGALTGQNAEMFADLLTGFAANKEVQFLIGTRLSAAGISEDERRIVLQVMARSGLKELPVAWGEPLADTLLLHPELVQSIVAVLRALPIKGDGAAKIRSGLLTIAADENVPIGVRLDAMAAVPGGLGAVNATLFEFVRKNLAPDAQVSVRLAAADVLSKAQLDDGQLLALAGDVRSAGPLEIERLVAPFAGSKNDEVGRAVIAALAASTALPNVRAETLKDVFKGYEPAVQEQTQTLYDLLAASAAKRKNKIEQLLALVPDGDIKRGQLIFNSQKAACASCHAIGYLGGTVGPDLTRIGQIRSERDLLEAVVYPSASFVRSYEPMSVLTTAGVVHNGIVRKDAPDEVILVTSAKDTVRIPRDEIEEMVPGTVSIMPTGLDEQLSAQDLADLVTFLKACK